MELQVKQIVSIDENILNTITNWMYEWWGKSVGYSIDEIRCYMEHSMQKDRIPQTYGLFLQGKIIGMYQFNHDDLSVRPDIYPWLANVYIDKQYRGKGYGRKLIETVRPIAQDKISFDEIFLYTEHIDLYEKFGWEFVANIDTYSKKPRIQRLYKLKLK